MSSVLLECKRYDLDLVNQIVQSKVNLFWCTEVSVNGVGIYWPWSVRGLRTASRAGGADWERRTKSQIKKKHHLVQCMGIQ